MVAVVLLSSSCQKEANTKGLPEIAYQLSSITTTSTTAAIGSTNYVFDEGSLTTAGWTRIFVDEFLTANYSNWNIWTGGAYNNELQYYQAANLSVTNNDYLNITAKKQLVTGSTTPFDATPKKFSYTSARLESKVLFSSSATTPKVRMVARIKLPAGYGMWPAFWSYGDP